MPRDDHGVAEWWEDEEEERSAQKYDILLIDAIARGEKPRRFFKLEVF